MRKADVQTHNSGGYGGPQYPAVNVKVHRGITRDTLDTVERHSALPGFAEWAEPLLNSGKWPEWTWDASIEQGWERLTNDAREVFGDHVKVYSAGRSGGWCIVQGLPDIESWDAIMLGKWARFEKWARATADGIPYDMAYMLAVNTYANEVEIKAAIARAARDSESQIS